MSSNSLSALNDSLMRVKAERDTLLQAAEAAFHALRSYQYGNASPDLAEEIADRLDLVLKLVKHGGTQ